MSEEEKPVKQKQEAHLGRRDFFFTVIGGAIAAIAGWISGSQPKDAGVSQVEEPTPTGDDSKILALEAEVARLAEALLNLSATQPLAELEGGGEIVTFNKKELSVINPDGVMVNLVATQGGVGFRFYKDFFFGNEQETNPWSIWIEGIPGYQGLSIIRDWRFTAALWDEDGRLLLGRLHPHPPANEPAKARLHVRGTVDEVQAIVEASAGQTADILQIIGGGGTAHLAVNNEGNVVIGSSEQPQEVILYDSQDKSAYSLKVTNGQLVLTRT